MLWLEEFSPLAVIKRTAFSHEEGEGGDEEGSSSDVRILGGISITLLLIFAERERRTRAFSTTSPYPSRGHGHGRLSSSLSRPPSAGRGRLPRRRRADRIVGGGCMHAARTRRKRPQSESEYVCAESWIAARMPPSKRSRVGLGRIYLSSCTYLAKVYFGCRQFRRLYWPTGESVPPKKYS